ncbi:DegT/DnrJ/EryC1/StrS aminotransferase family protein [Glaesserella parasuis]|uniref:DegT/DnrJ/EryC1/StrS family aminotransferase n=1 Tax=Glaesserella parasuis TaxID=738 RepID=UPI00095023EB|nr:DegT/DnrJ/EryC1/StrS aminotransferase family protein [Glaesserella parasuis]MDG6252002.1 DegT/DnrJ/EryC1/StrS aminotransferase family protein [Glaesserella parasuis]MDG6352072.1 DegT/DnrJ/EryC1/StrS aminotransferase family protein [Glaesserella parasuis]MDG6468995.1 DegT/DnrJ/EryC1/StrS aminotransferase family protein [Glaesserella parasuis]MDG6485872.1 DegT/DnrJ/EryC1/StrS aminotransferase family protein [Glaesserella parasuis]MDG6792701.1 DegT/DnrJ/EryC1/StrS aminotransferase family prote
MLNTNYAPWPCFTQEEADAVSKTILSNKVNYWTGTECREFEKEFAEFAQTKYAISLTNGTVALDVALKALGIGIGDDVIVTSRTFLASASAIVTAGANPIFADVELDSQNISRRTIEAVLTPNTKAIICVHLAGLMCDMDPIMALAEEKGLYVIEDCAQAHGAMYKGRSAGSIGHIGAWSFCQDKIMTTGGEGGMVTTNDKALWDKMWSYKDHGKSFDSVYNKQHPPGFRWVHDSFGTNWRMMEVQAVIGRIQLKRMPEWTKIRNQNMELILSAFDNCPYFTVNRPSEDYIHAAYKCYVQVNSDALPQDWDRDRIMNVINELGTPCYSGSCSEVYLEKAFDNTPWRPERRLENAKKLGETSLMFLVHPTLTEENLNKTIDVIRNVIKQLSEG